MKRWTWLASALCAATLIVLASRAQAEDPPVPSTAQGTGTVQGSAQGSVEQAQDQAKLDAELKAKAEAKAKADAKVQARLAAIKERGAKISAKSRAEAEAKLSATMKEVNDHQSTDGEQKLAARLAAEFGTSAEAVLAEKRETGCSWGELMLAHTLDANSEEDVTAAQLIQLHKDGTGWGQICAGLGFKLGEVVTAARAESRVAAGLAQPDGKAAQLTGGARVGIGPAAGATVEGAADVGAGASLPAVPPVTPPVVGKP